MAVNFPDNPTNGDTTVVNGVTYTYNATNNLWKAGSSSSSGGSGGTTTYATAAELPQTATNGDLALVEETDKLYIWNDTAWYNIALINTAPSITQGGAGSYTLATDGTPTVITLTATDPESLPITWSYEVTSGSLTNGGGVTATVTQADNVFTITPTTTEAYEGTFTLTFSVTDGANIVNDVNSFSLEFITGVQDSKYTSFLLKTDVSLSDDQVDASTWTHTINESGGVTSTAVTPYHPRGYSLQLDGNDYITPGFNDNFGNGDFTFECWAKTTVGGIIMGQYDGGSQMEAFEILTTTGVMASHTDSGTEGAAGTKDLRDNLWHHLVWERHSGTYYYYADGVLQDSRANTENGTQSSGWYIGRHGTANTGYYTGEIRDLKFTAGSAVYGGTTPSVPTELTVDGTETFVFATGLPYGKDLSTNSGSRTITYFGDPQFVLGGPYDYLTYDSATHGGSVYFDGNGDTMSIPTSIGVNFNSNTDFTIECWIYKTGSFKNYDSVWSKYDTGGDGSGPWLHINNSGNIMFGTTGLNGQTSTQTIKLNRWHHIAVVRDNPTIKVYLDGVATSISLTYSNSIGSNVHPFLIGNINGYSRWFEGFISDLRINNGTAVYTTDFTPPDEPLTAISGTTLLTCTNKNSIWDAAGEAALINIGDPTASTTQYKWSNSLYVDGVDDSVYFTLPDVLQTMGRTGTECTIEAWVYMVSAPAANTYVTAIYSVGAQGTTTGTNVISLEIQENQTVRALVNGAYSSLTGCPVSTGTVPTGQWTHLALVLYNQTWTIYINGTADGTGTGSYPSGTTHNAAYIGRSFYAANRTTEMYIEDLRISPRHARYTANFTPPTGSLEG